MWITIKRKKKQKRKINYNSSNSGLKNREYFTYQPFNWARELQGQSQISTYWQKQGQPTIYDQNSHALESKNINGNFSAVKWGYDSKYMIASSEQANYNEIAFSSAEDLNTTGNTLYFGGEVFKNSGIVDNTIAHTGNNSLKVLQNGYGFSYVAKIGEETGIQANKKYRASIWMYDNGNKQANLYFKITNGSGVIVPGTNDGAVSFESANPEIKVGRWKLLYLDINISEPTPGAYNGYYLGISCTNPESAPAFFDDFRFYPLNAGLICKVYDPVTGWLTYTLDKDGFYTRFEYDGAGRITATYQETLKGEIKVSSHKYNFGKP